jgi:hypothetical protein
MVAARAPLYLFQPPLFPESRAETKLELGLLLSLRLEFGMVH